MNQPLTGRLDALPPDMREALAGAGNDAEAIVGKLLTELEAAPTPTTLYHYTDEAGLKGILASGHLWLTDILRLNDPSELTHGLDHAARVLNAKAATGPPESKLFARDFEEFIQLGKIQRSGEYFSVSFSSQRDDLDQWRAYANNGRGYALGFDARMLEGAFLSETGAPILTTFPVSYNDAHLVDIHRQLIDRVFGLICLPRGRGLSTQTINGYMAHLFTITAVHSLHAGLHFKHEAYRHEQEYRFLRVYPPETPSPRAKVRGRAGASVKFETFNWNTAHPSPLRCIVLGPAADVAGGGTNSATESLIVAGRAEVEIVRSSIPYRAA